MYVLIKIVLMGQPSTRREVVYIETGLLDVETLSNCKRQGRTGTQTKWLTLRRQTNQNEWTVQNAKHHARKGITPPDTTHIIKSHM